MYRKYDRYMVEQKQNEVPPPYHVLGARGARTGSYLLLTTMYYNMGVEKKNFRFLLQKFFKIILFSLRIGARAQRIL